MDDTYKIAVSAKTYTYFMHPYKVSFFIYTNEEIFLSDPIRNAAMKNEVYLVETGIEDINELDTMLYNAGFQRGTIDKVQHIISKPNINYTNVNKNDTMLAQYILTGDKRYLKEINKEQLYTLVQIDKNNKVYYPTIKDRTGVKILAYTTPFNIPNDMYMKYKDFTVIKTGYLGRENHTFLINNQFSA